MSDKVVDVDFKNANNSEQVEENIDIENDPVLKKAIEKTREDENIIEKTVHEFVNVLKAKIEDPNDKFNHKHGFLTAAKIINILGAYSCKDEEEFTGEIVKARKLISDNILPAIPESDQMNLSMRRLLFVAGSLPEYLYWHENLGNIEQEQGSKTE